MERRTGELVGPSVGSVLRRRWRETRARTGAMSAMREIGADLWEFLRESTPERKRLRYGDVEYDWEHHVDTTSATVSARGRLIAAISGAPYQPTDSEAFRKMVNAVGVDFRDYTFIDIGSGKGRTLLMASEFPFYRILGVELLPELNSIARANVASFPEAEQKCSAIETVCADAREFVFPEEPLLLYLFNPLPAAALEQVIENLRESVEGKPRAVRVLYHNPQAEQVLARSGFLFKVDGTFQYSIYSNWSGASLR
jgi:SAM-dependent methyltransferase